MSNITLQTEGRRVYIIGNSFPIKEQIKSAGGHWDSDRKAWWIGAGKKEEIEKAISGAPAEQKKEEEIYDGEVKGKASYKGKTYYVRFYGTTVKGESFRLVTLDGKLSFWADAVNVEWVKQYQGKSECAWGIPGRAGGARTVYPTLHGIRKFIEEKKEIDKGGECPTCARNFASGRWAPYFGSGDYDDCPQCGVTHREL